MSPKGRFTVQRAPENTTAVSADSTPSPGGESSNYTTASESVAVVEKGLESIASAPQLAAAAGIAPQQEISVSNVCFCTFIRIREQIG